MAITNDRYPIEELASIIMEIQDYVDYVHIREKSKTVQEIFLLLQLLDQAKVRKEKIVVHDRLDLALITGVPNVHLPGSGLPVNKVKENFPHLRVGRSVHSLKEAMSAAIEGADYVLFGHLYDTKCKEGKPARGLEAFIQMKKALDIFVYPIGGITVNHINILRSEEAAGAAIMSGIFDSPKPGEAAKQFRERASDNSISVSR